MVPLRFFFNRKERLKSILKLIKSLKLYTYGQQFGCKFIFKKFTFFIKRPTCQKLFSGAASSKHSVALYMPDMTAPANLSNSISVDLIV